MAANTGYTNLNKTLWGLEDGCKFRTLHNPDLYILVVSKNIVLISSFFLTSRLFRQYPVLSALSILVPKDICIQQNNQIMPNLESTSCELQGQSQSII